MYARTYLGLIYILGDSLAALVEDGFEQRRVEAESWVRRPCRFSRRKPVSCPHGSGASGKKDMRGMHILDPGLRKLTSGLDLAI